MDASFEEAYGSDVLSYRGGHANVWPRHDQLMVAMRGYAGPRLHAVADRGGRLRPALGGVR